MKHVTTCILTLLFFMAFTMPKIVQGQDVSVEKDTIKIQIELPNGNTTKQDTLVEGDSLELSGLPFPLHIMNGGELAFSDSSLSHDITITISLPSFTSIDQQQQQISFGDSVANAVRFEVTSGDSTIDPFAFNEPISLTLPIPDDLPPQIGEKVSNLMLSYRDTTGNFDSEGIQTVARDSVKGIVKAEVSHFSDIVMTSTEVTDSTEAGNSVAFEIKTPQGDIARTDSISEGQTLTMSGFAFPFHYLNGSELSLPDSAISEDVTISVEVPEFAEIDQQQQQISFGDSVASAVEFNVSVEDSAVHPFEFDAPVTLTLAIPQDLPAAIENRQSDFVLTFRDSTGTSDTTGIQTIEVDSANGVVKARVEHFSTISMTAGEETATNLEKRADAKPTKYQLYENYPNPFNPSTTIQYDLKEAGHVTLTIYNMLGQKVTTLVDRQQQSGQYSVNFDATELSSGTYIYRLEAGEYSAVQKMILIK